MEDLEAIMHLHNNSPLDDFEGFSPADMRYLVHDPFSDDSPMQIRKEISDETFNMIPFLRQTEFLLNEINREGEIKLTAHGFLPVKLVKKIYDQGIIRDEHIEVGIIKIYNEKSSITIRVTRIIAELAGLVQKKKNAFSLSAKARKLVLKESRRDLFILLFSTFATRFNWGYFDGYPSPNTGQLGFAYTLFLLSKYGDVLNPDTFYALKYTRAFPSLLDEGEPVYLDRDPQTTLNHCYSVRTFERFLAYFNLVELHSQNKKILTGDIFVKKTPVFDKIFFFRD